MNRILYVLILKFRSAYRQVVSLTCMQGMHTEALVGYFQILFAECESGITEICTYRRTFVQYGCDKEIARYYFSLYVCWVLDISFAKNIFDKLFK